MAQPTASSRPERPDLSARGRWAARATAGLIALLVYLLTLAPTLPWAHDEADGGDLVVAVLTGGVPHPSGYPTYLLLGSLFARLQVGDPAFRLNLMSAVSAAAAAAVTGWYFYYGLGQRPDVTMMDSNYGALNGTGGRWQSLWELKPWPA